MKNLLIFVKFNVAYISGKLIFLYYLVKYSPYYGSQKVYKKLQADGSSFSKKCLLIYLDNDFENQKSRIKNDYKYMIENLNKERVTSELIERYSTDNVGGYGNLTFNKGGENLSSQQRGLILPMLEAVLSKMDKNETVCEVGAADGDVIAHLAGSFPKLNFIGVDFSIKNAQKKHSKLKNLHFEKGYALELLEKNKLKGDVVFFSSTAVLFLPKELESYLKKFYENGFENIFISEPSWSFYEYDEKDDKAFSQHLEINAWFHNYPLYLKNAGYKIMEQKIINKYQHPASKREDINIFLGHAIIDK